MDIYQLKHYLLYEMADKDSKNVLCTLHSCTTKESLSNDYGTPWLRDWVFFKRERDVRVFHDIGKNHKKIVY